MCTSVVCYDFNYPSMEWEIKFVHSFWSNYCLNSLLHYLFNQFSPGTAVSLIILLFIQPLFTLTKCRIVCVDSFQLVYFVEIYVLYPVLFVELVFCVYVHDFF